MSSFKMLVKFTPVFQIPPCQLPEGSRELCTGRPRQLFYHCLAWEHGWSRQACGSVRALTVQCSVQPQSMCVSGSWGQSLWGYGNNGTNTHLDALLFSVWNASRYTTHEPTRRSQDESCGWCCRLGGRGQRHSAAQAVPKCVWDRGLYQPADIKDCCCRR